MIKYFISSLSLVLLLSTPAFAKLKVVGTYPYIQDLVKQVAQDKVEIQSLASGDWDPHVIVPKPSLLIRLRQADLLIINGAQLEIGWLPPLLQQAGNANIQPGKAGFLELSTKVALIQKPQSVARSMGDVHPQGNPHFLLDPNNVPLMVEAIAKKLCQLEAPSCQNFNQNASQFKQRWQKAALKWQEKMNKLKGTPVVEYHRLHDYFFYHYGFKVIGTLEPLPGIPPTPQHLTEMVKQIKEQKVTLNIRGVYNPNDPSAYISQHSSARLVTLPHDIGSVPEVQDVFSLFETLVKRMGE